MMTTEMDYVFQFDDDSTNTISIPRDALSDTLSCDTISLATQASSIHNDTERLVSMRQTFMNSIEGLLDAVSRTQINLATAKTLYDDYMISWKRAWDLIPEHMSSWTPTEFPTNQEGDLLIISSSPNYNTF